MSDCLSLHELCGLPEFHDLPQGRMLEWEAIPFFTESSQPRDWTWVSSIAVRFFTIWATSKTKDGLISSYFATDPSQSDPKGQRVPSARYVYAQSLLTLCDPMDCSPPDSSVNGIFQTRIVERVANFSSRGSAWPRDQCESPALAGRFSTAEPPGKPLCQVWLVHWTWYRGQACN